MNFDKNAVRHFLWGNVYFRIDAASEEVVGQQGDPVIQLEVSLADKKGHQRKDRVTIFQDYNDENSPFVQLFTASNAKTERDLVGFSGSARAWQTKEFTRMSSFVASQPAPEDEGGKQHADD